MLAQVLPGMVLPTATVESAYNMIRSKLREIRQAPGRLHARQMQAAEVARQARTLGESEAAAQAHALVRQFGELKLEAGDLVGRINALQDAVPGLGALPVAVVVASGAAIVAIATAATILLRKATERERELELLEKGVLTPEQIRDLRESIPTVPTGPLAAVGVEIGSAVKWLLLGVAGVMLFPQIAKMLKGK